MDKINFGARYDLSDKANIFSYGNKRKIHSIVKQLAKDDLVCIGTRKYKTLEVISGEPIDINGVRIDYIVGDKSSSIRLDQEYIESEITSVLGKNASKKEKQKLYKNIVFDNIYEILKDLTQFPKKSKTAETFAQKCMESEARHKMLLDVRQWSRLRKTYNKDSFFERFRNEFYKIKDSYTE